ncbi:hypothetical protein PPGU16_31780 [Paraburkholderia largidicola]|uniref:Uncharacterized protein n=1 Tax=Paraburkholderia largidicola TaxID=3014751 RepID=A0A7I8BPH6_9BURK|nr:hypothetical protein PPGU16_31780 [Paraburkholderia sp. PGU16]
MHIRERRRVEQAFNGSDKTLVVTHLSTQCLVLRDAKQQTDDKASFLQVCPIASFAKADHTSDYVHVRHADDRPSYKSMSDSQSSRGFSFLNVYKPLKTMVSPESGVDRRRSIEERERCGMIVGAGNTQI